MESIRVIFAKESKDHLRDKRSLALSLVFPLLAPIMVGALLYFVSHSNIEGATDFRINAPIAGAENAPELMAYLTEHNVVQRPAPLVREFQEEAVDKGTLPFILVIPAEAAGKDIFNVELMLNRGSPQSMAMATGIMRHLSNYSRLQGRQMLETAGLDPGIATPLTVTEVAIGKTINTVFLFYNMIPSLLMFMIFMGAVYLAIDVSVGERERGSLEALLITPVSRPKLLLGKSLAAFVFTSIIVFINLVAFYVSLSWATSGADNITPPPDAGVFFLLFLISLPLMAFAVSLQMTIAFMTRSAKEAQIYLGLLPVVPLVPGLLMVFSPVDPTPLISAVPIYGQLALYIDIVSGTGIDWLGIFYSMAGTTIAAMVVFGIAMRLFEREKTILGTT